MGERRCQARFYAPEIFGFLPSFRGEEEEEEENVWFRLNLHGEGCGFITLKVKPNQKVDFCLKQLKEDRNVGR